MSEATKIIAEPQFEPTQCKFILEKTIVEDASYPFLNKEDAVGSPIAESIFKIPDVCSILVAADSITVTMNSEETDWREAGKEIGNAIREAIASGSPLIASTMKDKLPSEKEIREKVGRILEEEVNPSVASHGGFIELLDVKNNDIYVKMGGGCQGCGLSRATLKRGVEKAFRREIPYLGAVYDTTDHAGGANPYFSS